MIEDKFKAHISKYDVFIISFSVGSISFDNQNFRQCRLFVNQTGISFIMCFSLCLVKDIKDRLDLVEKMAFLI